VSEGTRAKVFAYVGRPGVDSSTPVRRQDPGATHNLSLVIPKHFMQLDLPFLRKCMGGVCTMAAQRGYDPYDGPGPRCPRTARACQLASHKVDGVILSRTMNDDPSIDLLQQYGVPFVAIGRIENDDIPQADNDQLGAASEMTRVLFQMGARRIAYLGGSGTYTVNADRLRGYLRGLAEFGVPADQSLIRTGIESDEQRTDALEAVLEQHPDCLLCCDDRIAFDLMRELRNRHIRVPEQLRLASLYDSELLAGTTPAISAVQFDAERLGSTACRMLLDVMAGKDIPLRQVQGYQVILRESTK
jgi:DNA-binding LacI/PurR family transcriptional regulator